MKQFLLLMFLTMAGGIASPYHPFWGLLLYYTLAVLRPQYMWKWALPVEWRWSLFAAVIVAIGVMLNLNRILNKARFTPIAMIMLGYAVMLTLSCLTADNPALAASWGQEYAKILVIALIATLVLDQLWHIRAMAVMMVAMLGYIAWEVNYLYLFNSRLDIFHHGYGGLDNNGAGLMLAMGIPLAYAFGVSATKQWQRNAAWIVALLILHAVMMTYSRGAMVATLVGAAWLLVQHRNRRQTVVIAAAACLAVTLLAGQEIRNRFYSTSNYQDDNSARSRLDSWNAAWTMAWERPFTGNGIRNANIYTQNYGADRHGRTVHSVYLQIAADSGIPAMLLYTAMIVLSMLGFSRVRRTCRDQLAQRDGDRQAQGKRGPPEEESALPDAALIRHCDALALGLQGSLLVFAFGALFLSVEVFEMPWLLVALASAMPGAVDRFLTGEAKADDMAVRHSPPTPFKAATAVNH